MLIGAQCEMTQMMALSHKVFEVSFVTMIQEVKVNNF